MAANFKKSLREIVKGRDPKVVMMDYFWLQPGYYEERYGMNFLDSKVRELFVSHDCKVMLLPVDSRGAVRAMYDGSFADRPTGDYSVKIDFVSESDGLRHHPLVRATRHIDAELRDLAKRVKHSKGRWHEMQMLRLAYPDPFLVVYRAGLDWRRYLDSLCVLGPASEPGPLELRPPAPPPRFSAKRKRQSKAASPLPPGAAVSGGDADSDEDEVPVAVLLARAAS